LVKNDFVEVIDEVTGEKVLKLTAAAAIRKGLSDLQDVEFEVYVDPNTGAEQIRVKGGTQTGKTSMILFLRSSPGILFFYIL